MNTHCVTRQTLVFLDNISVLIEVSWHHCVVIGIVFLYGPHGEPMPMGDVNVGYLSFVSSLLECKRECTSNV